MFKVMTIVRYPDKLTFILLFIYHRFTCFLYTSLADRYTLYIIKAPMPKTRLDIRKPKIPTCGTKLISQEKKRYVIKVNKVTAANRINIEI
nr:MAG TPA: hypothetical protein [Caudoviricetes sp.]